MKISSLIYAALQNGTITMSNFLDISKNFNISLFIEDLTENQLEKLSLMINSKEIIEKEIGVKLTIYSNEK